MKHFKPVAAPPIAVAKQRFAPQEHDERTRLQATADMLGGPLELPDLALRSAALLVAVEAVLVPAFTANSPYHMRYTKDIRAALQELRNYIADACEEQADCVRIDEQHDGTLR